MRTVGILGGMGPEATVLLMQRLLQAVDARDDADHIPLIVHQNPAVPSRIARLIDGAGEDPGPVLAQMARDLQAAGAGTFLWTKGSLMQVLVQAQDLAQDPQLKH
jgi:aspartate racemase